MIAIARPNWFKPQASIGLKCILGLGLSLGLSLGYAWTVFTVAFGLGAIAGHLPVYTMPACLLFLSGGILHMAARARQNLSS